MKKLALLLLVPFLTMCGPTNTQVRDDFKSVSEKEKERILKEMNASSPTKSVLLFTQGFKGEKIIAKQNDKNVYSGYPISNLKTQYAASFSFINTSNLVINDTFSKEELVIETKKAQQHKFIYIKKEYKEGKAKYLITFSNTLRPLE